MEPLRIMPPIATATAPISHALFFEECRGLDLGDKFWRIPIRDHQWGLPTFRIRCHCRAVVEMTRQTKTVEGWLALAYYSGWCGACDQMFWG